MDVLNPDTLLLKINPAVDSTKTVEQIQSYYYLINNEISKYYNYQTIKKELNEKNEKLENIFKYCFLLNYKFKINFRIFGFLIKVCF